jgi:hypothetical protein
MLADSPKPGLPPSSGIPMPCAVLEALRSRVARRRLHGGRRCAGLCVLGVAFSRGGQRRGNPHRQRFRAASSDLKHDELKRDHPHASLRGASRRSNPPGGIGERLPFAVKPRPREGGGAHSAFAGDCFTPLSGVRNDERAGGRVSIHHAPDQVAAWWKQQPRIMIDTGHVRPRHACRSHPSPDTELSPSPCCGERVRRRTASRLSREIPNVAHAQRPH